MIIGYETSLNTFIILVQTWQNFITEHVYIKYLYKHDKTSSLNKFIILVQT
jgi:hypothetical protein